MSFSYQVKEELLNLYEHSYSEEEKPCCHHAEQYGLFLFCREFSLSEMGVKFEYKAPAEKYVSAVKELTGHKPKLEHNAGGKYHVTVEKKEDRAAVLEAFGYTGTEINRRLNRANLEDECCNKAFLRGAFLSCGTITNPEKDYHLEFVVAQKTLCTDFLHLLNELEMKPKYVRRSGLHVIYFKDSESVEDLLTFMGATESSLELMGTKIYKDIRNNVNRKMNFENANAGRSFNAAYKQVEAIRYIEETRGLQYLPPDLIELATLRREHVEYTMQELADNLKHPISKSGVNHRLKRIVELSEELRIFEEMQKEKQK